MKTIEQLIEKRTALEQELVGVKKQIVALKMEAVKRNWKIAVGSVVKSTRTGKKYKVDSIEDWSVGRPWVRGYEMKKDGTFGKVYRRLYGDWLLTDDEAV